MDKTAERIIGLMKQHNDSAYALEKKVELPVSTIAAWKKDRFKPSADVIVKIAQYYNVATDYLLCLTDEPISLKTHNTDKRQNAFLTTNLSKLSYDKRFIETAKMYMVLPDIYRERIYGIIQGLIMGLGYNIKNILEK